MTETVSTATTPETPVEKTPFLQTVILERRWQLIYGLLWVFLSIVMALLLRDVTDTGARINAYTVLTGSVTKREEIRADAENSSGAAPGFYLTVQYDVDPGLYLDARTRTVAVSQVMYDAYPENSPIQIYFSPGVFDNPLLEPQNELQSLTRMVVMGGLLWLVLTVRLVVDLYARRRYP